MHQAIWDDFGEKFASDYTVITVDLPGFGKSPSLPEGFTLDAVADEVLSFIRTHKLSELCVVGHSLGGYVALAALSKQPQLFSSLILFHSTAYADSEERKESRNKVLEFVTRNGALPFTTGFIAPLFVDQQHEAIERMKEIAAATPSDTVMGYTKAMRDRKNHVKTLRNFEKPTLLLAGEKDQGITVQSVYEQAKGCKNAEIDVLENVAHMGMVEQTMEAESRIKDFLKKI